MNQIMIYIASPMTGLWGSAHLFAAKGVVTGFGDLSADNRRIITMEWIVEGVALISIAAFVATVTIIQPEALLSQSVYVVAVVNLIALTVVSLFTGFRVALLPFRLCPFIFCASAASIVFGVWL